jgi:hypothetical protein
MAAKKMFPPGEVDRLLSRVYDEFKLKISFRIQAGQVFMQFSDSVDRIRMTAGGARKLAAMLIEKAAELDRLGTASASGARRVRPKPSSDKSPPAQTEAATLKRR